MSDDMATTIEREAAQRPGRPSPAAPEQPDPAKSGGNKRTVFIIMGVVLLDPVALGGRRLIHRLNPVSPRGLSGDTGVGPEIPRPPPPAPRARNPHPLHEQTAPAVPP